MSELTKTSPLSKTAISVKDMALIGIMAAVCCILGPLSIPIGAVPVSLQVVAVILSAYVLGAKKGTLAVVIYILLGFVGLPVFSGFSGGAGKLFGATGGYIVGFIFMCYISGIFIEKFGVNKVYMQAAGIVSGLLVLYAFGTLWFTFINTKGIGFMNALEICVYPFVAIDAVKAAVCIILGNPLRKAVLRLNR